MGGDWIPTSFVRAAPEVWGYVQRFVSARRDDWYRSIAIKRDGPTDIIVREGRDDTAWPIDDGLLELVQIIKSAGERGAVVVDRVFEQCWITPSWDDAVGFVEYTNEIDDQDT